MEGKYSYHVDLRFEPIQLPPVTDILVLGKKNPQGVQGVKESFQFLAPDEFEVLQIKEHAVVSAVFIHKRILTRMPSSEVIKIILEHVVQHMQSDEVINVSFSVTMSREGIKGEYYAECEKCCN